MRLNNEIGGIQRNFLTQGENKIK